MPLGVVLLYLTKESRTCQAQMRLGGVVPPWLFNKKVTLAAARVSLMLAKERFGTVRVFRNFSSQGKHFLYGSYENISTYC